jgi:hypothetical protein
MVRFSQIVSEHWASGWKTASQNRSGILVKSLRKFNVYAAGVEERLAGAWTAVLVVRVTVVIRSFKVLLKIFITAIKHRYFCGQV